MGKIRAMTGNTAAYTGAALCRPDLIAAYPITPQSSVVEGLAGLVYNGKLDARFVQVESEHSAMSVVQGTAAAGGRVFTATSAQGLALMYEPYFRMSTLRIPMVMAIATREMTSPETIWSGQQDAMSVRDAGWIQIFCESNQEILDMMIQAYASPRTSAFTFRSTSATTAFTVRTLWRDLRFRRRKQLTHFCRRITAAPISIPVIRRRSIR